MNGLAREVVLIRTRTAASIDERRCVRCAPGVIQGRVVYAQYLSTQPPAIENQGGDAATYALACTVVRGYDLDEDEAPVAFAEWNQRCVPPWSENELAQKFDNARRYGNEAIGGRLLIESIAYVVSVEGYVARRRGTG